MSIQTTDIINTHITHKHKVSRELQIFINYYN